MISADQRSFILLSVFSVSLWSNILRSAPRYAEGSEINGRRRATHQISQHNRRSR